MLLFDLQLFGKKGTRITTTDPQVPKMSDEEKGLLGCLLYTSDAADEL